MVGELKCPYGDDFEGGDECDRCEQYELCMETYPPANLIEIPKGATNGDVIKAMFPNVNFGTLAQDDVIVNKDYSNNDEPQVFIPIRVWNAPYKSDCIPSEYDLSEDIELSNPQMYR